MSTRYAEEAHLYVHAIMPDGGILKVGRILSKNLQSPGRLEGFFKYDPQFLDHPQAYPVDPVNLPLMHNKVFAANNPNTGIHSIFEDSLPDAWGRQILARQGHLELNRSRPAHLLSVLHNKGLGRLLYSEQDRKPTLTRASISFSKITEAIGEARQLEKSLDTDSSDLKHLLACGSSAGGARPKVLTERDGTLCLAKLTSIKDPDPIILVALENAGMTLARQAGLQVPPFAVHTVENRSIFLIERFDVTRQNGRNAMISFKTMIGTDDYYEVSYSNLAEAIRWFSHQPEKDSELFFRQMVINVMLRNTDDHLQNFAMLHTKKGWELSPAYDIVPNIYQPGQILQIGSKHDNIDREDLIQEGKAFGLSGQKTKQLLNDVVERLANWQEVFAQCGVPMAHTGNLKKDINARFKRIALTSH